MKRQYIGCAIALVIGIFMGALIEMKLTTNDQGKDIKLLMAQVGPIYDAVQRAEEKADSRVSKIEEAILQRFTQEHGYVLLNKHKDFEVWGPQGSQIKEVKKDDFEVALPKTGGSAIVLLPKLEKCQLFRRSKSLEGKDAWSTTEERGRAFRLEGNGEWRWESIVGFSEEGWSVAIKM